MNPQARCSDERNLKVELLQGKKLVTSIPFILFYHWKAQSLWFMVFQSVYALLFTTKLECRFENFVVSYPERNLRSVYTHSNKTCRVEKNYNKSILKICQSLLSKHLQRFECLMIVASRFKTNLSSIVRNSR